MKRRWRTWRAELPDVVGARVELSREETHHLQRVLRLGEHDRIGVFDGRGTEWQARIVKASARRLEVELELRLAEAGVDPTHEVVLFQAVGRPEKIDQVVQRVTELGVAEVRLVATRGSQSRPTPSRLERWQRILVESCKQCGRRRLPGLGWCDGVPRPPAQGCLALMLHTAAGAPPIGQALAGPRPAATWLAVGPESGFQPAELDSWLAAGWSLASLGPRVLRTETAGPAAVAVVLHRFGDLGSESPV